MQKNDASFWGFEKRKISKKKNDRYKNDHFFNMGQLFKIKLIDYLVCPFMETCSQQFVIRNYLLTGRKP